MTCIEDCGFCAYCGDDSCGNGETCDTCAQDCGICAEQFCVGGGCRAALGENCGTCPRDCGECQPTCGDGVCDPTEDCQTCRRDCGSCLEVEGFSSSSSEPEVAPVPVSPPFVPEESKTSSQVWGKILEALSTLFTLMRDCVLWIRLTFQETIWPMVLAFFERVQNWGRVFFGVDS